jgi:hypothetical protein
MRLGVMKATARLLASCWCCWGEAGSKARQGVPAAAEAAAAAAAGYVPCTVHGCLMLVIGRSLERMLSMYA